MAICGIMRVEKRGRAAVYGLQIEANRTEDDHAKGREFDRSDIDWSRTKDNERLIDGGDRWNTEITRQIKAAGVKEKKDSVVMLDGLYTASPQWFAEHTKEEAEQYFRDCLDFHVREYCAGDRSRVVNAVIHWDETTPHMQVASVPLIEDAKGWHLSAKIIMGGRDDYRKRQDRFFEQVTKSRGMDRGELQDATHRKHHELTQEHNIRVNEETLEKQAAETKDLEQRAGDAKQAIESSKAARRQAKAQAEQAAKDLQEILTLKRKAAGIRKPHFWEKKDTRTIDGTMADAIEEITDEVERQLHKVSDRAEKVAKREADVADKERSIQPLYDAAAEDRRQAKEYRDNEESYILGTADKRAQEMFDAFLQQEFGEEAKGREKRLRKLCETIRFEDGTTVLQRFEQEEQEREEHLRSSWHIR